jgi:hypothetical protein
VSIQKASPEDVAAILAEANFKHGALHTVMAEARKRTGLAKANLDESYAKLADLVHTINEARDEALGVLQDAEPPGIPELPEPDLPEEPANHLFTTEDDYVTATLKLKARKGYLV